MDVLTRLVIRGLHPDREVPGIAMGRRLVFDLTLADKKCVVLYYVQVGKKATRRLAHQLHEGKCQAVSVDFESNIVAFCLHEEDPCVSLESISFH